MQDNVCSICGCGEKETPKFYYHTRYGDNLCNKHYIQLNRYGKIIDREPSYKIEHKCFVCGDTTGKFRICNIESDIYGKSLCTKHYTQMRTHGKITDIHISQNKVERKCCICNKVEGVIYNPEDGKMYCRKHYDHLYNYGKILDETVFDRNKFEIYDDYVEIILKNRKFEEVARTIIDLEDLDMVIKYKWNLNPWGYATCAKNEYYMLQNFILGEKGLVDHINRNSLDNRKSNLIMSNKSLNALNCGLRENNKSGVTGVSYSNRTCSYRVYINWQGKRLELGHYKCFEKAVIIRLLKEKELLDDLAPQRHLFKEYNIQ